MEIRARAALRTEVARLPRPARELFAAACAERLVLNFRPFQQASAVGDDRLLRQACDWVWRGISQREHVLALDARRLVRSLSEMAPDVDEYPSSEANFALEACAAASHAVNTVATGDAKEAYLAAVCCRSTANLVYFAVTGASKLPAEHSALSAEIECEAESLRAAVSGRYDTEVFRERFGRLAYLRFPSPL